jgi:DNA-binding Lrp family transcriptional regulator
MWIGTRTRAEYLRRLAVVHAVEIRLTIVTELFIREMSPTGFYRQFGGGSPSRVAKNFKRLEENGWLRYIRSEPAPGGRGVEDFYRATELAMIDTETWALLPYSIKVAHTWSTFKQFVERVAAAIQEKTLDRRHDRVFSHAQIFVDQHGWDRILENVDALFAWVLEEQEDAKLRMFHTGEKPIFAIASQLGFEAAEGGETAALARLARLDQEWGMSFAERLAKVISDELCLKIVGEANLREISPTGFHAEFGGSVHQVHRRFKTLERLGWLKKVEMKTGGRRRGAREYFYRATAPAIVESLAWAELPDSAKEARSWATFVQLSEQIKAAIRAGTYDARDDRYFVWSLLQLDEQGWKNAVEKTNDVLAFLYEEQERAAARMAESGEEPIPMIVALAVFEAPNNIKQP